MVEFVVPLFLFFCLHKQMTNEDKVLLNSHISEEKDSAGCITGKLILAIMKVAQRASYDN